MRKKKRILLLGPQHQRLINFLLANEDDVVMTDAPLEDNLRFFNKFDFIISYGYRHIIRKTVIDHFGCLAINLHCSLLPWNRGADPNLWSFLEDTPKGVTIHCIDEGIDTGKILAQREVAFELSETLHSSYEKLSFAMEKLFIEKWDDIRSGAVIPIAQPAGGSYHRSRDLIPFEHLLTNGWDTQVAELVGKGLKGTK